MNASEVQAEAWRRKRNLAVRYRLIAEQFTRAADRLDSVTVEQLAAMTQPVRYLHASTREAEDGLDEWLMRL